MSWMISGQGSKMEVELWPGHCRMDRSFLDKDREQRLGGMKIHGISGDYEDVGGCAVKKQKMRPHVRSES